MSDKWRVMNEEWWVFCDCIIKVEKWFGIQEQEYRNDRPAECHSDGESPVRLCGVGFVPVPIAIKDFIAVIYFSHLNLKSSLKSKSHGILGLMPSFSSICGRFW